MMRKDSYIQYEILSEVLKYPSSRFPEKVNKCREMLNSQYPDTLISFEKFSDWVLNTPLDEMEEVFTKTFHIQAICYLDLGYVIFGEDYKRGEFLVNMKREQQKADNNCGEELPDNLVNILTLIPKIKDDLFRKELSVRIVVPAIKKMLEEFKTARMELKTKILRKKHRAILQENQRNGNIYQYALKAILEVFNEDFEGIHYNEPKPSLGAFANDFTATACGSCSFINNTTTKTVKT